MGVELPLKKLCGERRASYKPEDRMLRFRRRRTSKASTIAVTSGVVLYATTTDDALLISHTDFPGLLRFCLARNEIDEFRAEQSVEDVST
ncbi:MAG: hypothetical protein JWO85_1356 [Candidatus Eremiobacteraeota bacterium]|nr:hypothetical protein [Candidatus Eremiobacteraeota bacterium]